MNYNVQKTADDRAKNSRDHVAKNWGNYGSKSGHLGIRACEDIIFRRYPRLVAAFPEHQVLQKRVMRAKLAMVKPAKPSRKPPFKDKTAEKRYWSRRRHAKIEVRRPSSNICLAARARNARQLMR